MDARGGMRDLYDIAYHVLRRWFVPVTKIRPVLEL
jgi:hypothetical protein